MDVDLESEFRNFGFLSPNIGLIEDQIKSRMKREMDLLRDINHLLVRLVMQSSVAAEGLSSLSTKVISIVSGLRTMGNLQGAILLLEKGMVVEAKILARCIYESAFCVGALIKEPERFLSMLESDNRASKHGIAGSMRGMELSDQQAETLSEAINTIEKGRYLNIKDVADLSELKGFYLFYKHLSDDAMHHSATSLSKHLESSGELWSGFLYGPADECEIKEAAFYCSNSSFAFTVAFSQVMENVDFEDEISRLWERVQELTSSSN